MAGYVCVYTIRAASAQGTVATKKEAARGAVQVIKVTPGVLTEVL